MIYEYLHEGEPIRQGDIFCNLPVPAFDLDSMTVVSDEELLEKRWEDITEPTTAIVVPIEKHWAIVASQDCDTNRVPSLTLFKIVTLDSSDTTPPKNVKGWVSYIKTRSVENASRFYLPSDERLGFNDRMLVLFQNVIQIKRESLESRVRTHRKGRLNTVADEHFRESIAQFFRRYPYNEWYPFTKEEFQYYSEDITDAKPYPWQE